MKETNKVVRKVVREGIGIACALLLVLLPFGVPAFAQTPAPAQSPAAQPSPQLLTPDQLDDLVAPVALYPDALLSQVLVASTYPLEIVEASQWLQQNPNLKGQQLVDAARQQNWDPSIQALVVFPDVIGRLASNISWASDLGNAFLAQQADVMNAVQRMRQDARSAGKLNSNSEQTVVTQSANGRTVIEIVPANPQVIYVPVYDPMYVWGPPAWGYYPAFYDPGISVGFGFGPGIYIGAYFGGWGGWGGWGWGPNWFNCTVVQNGFFFSHYGFRNYYGGGFARGGVWAHNPYHRMGVPYSNGMLANRFHGSYMGRGGVAHAGLGGRFHGYSGSRLQGAQSFGPHGGSATGGWRRLADPGVHGGQRALGGGSQVRGLPAGRASAGGGGQWSHFGGVHSASTGRSSGSLPGSGSYAGRSSGFRPSGGSYAGHSSASLPSSGSYAGRSSGFRPSGGSYAGHSAPAFHSSPSFSGGRSLGGSRPSFSGGGSRSFGGGGHSFGGGGGFHSSGGSRGGGGSHGGGRR